MQGKQDNHSLSAPAYVNFPSSKAASVVSTQPNGTSNWQHILDQSKPYLLPGTGLNIGWVTADEEEGFIAVRGNLGPSPCPYIDCCCDMWGWIGWLLGYPEIKGCEGEPETCCCLLLPGLLLPETIAEPTPGKPVGLPTPAAPNWGDIIRARSAAILCLARSTCSHSFINKVSTSANCFSFSSNLFNCVEQKSSTKC